MYWNWLITQATWIQNIYHPQCSISFGGLSNKTDFPILLCLINFKVPMNFIHSFPSSPYFLFSIPTGK